MNAPRRQFVKALGICLVAAHLPRPLAAQAAARSCTPARLAAAEWRCLEALCAEIIPTDDSPGATEAGCTNFIDKALATEDAAALPLYQAALAEIDRLSQENHGKAFAELTANQRITFMQAMEQGGLAGWQSPVARAQDFFATVRFHTLLGFIADPRHGGNQDYAGWKLMGFPGPLHATGGVSPAQMLGIEPVTPVWAEAAHSHATHHGR